MSADLLATLVTAHREVFDLLMAATEDLDAEAWSSSTGCPGWDVHDQLAHCVGLERRLLGDPPPEVEVPTLPHVDDDFSRVIEQDVQGRRRTSGERLREEALETFSRRLSALSSLDPSVLEEPIAGPGPMRGKGSTMLRIRVFDLCAHEQDIRRALGREREPDGACGQLVSVQVMRGLARVLPERLAGPGTVEVEMVGPHAATVAVELGDGTPEGGGSALLTRLRGTLGELLALSCGRSDAPGVDRLHVDGDRGLAEEAVRHAGMTP
jgi:uncharacterized protein (TIGR03083 family)